MSPRPGGTAAATRRPLVFAEQGSAAWDGLWALLEQEEGDRVAQDPETGECWQYMGTVLLPDGHEHQFRHRAHPASEGAPVYAHIRVQCPAVEEVWTNPDRHVAAVIQHDPPGYTVRHVSTTSGAERHEVWVPTLYEAQAEALHGTG